MVASEAGDIMSDVNQIRAENRLEMAIAVLDLISESALIEHGRHISNAAWAAKTLIEDALEAYDGGKDSE